MRHTYGSVLSSARPEMQVADAFQTNNISKVIHTGFQIGEHVRFIASCRQLVFHRLTLQVML